jgi:hypothetical protein
MSRNVKIHTAVQSSAVTEFSRQYRAASRDLYSLYTLTRSTSMPHKKKEKEREKKINGTRYSQQVTHASTNRARQCLTAVIEREPVLPL